MKFMDRIFTQEGPGVVVARGVDGMALVSIRREEAVGVRCSGPCVNLMMQRCEAHGVWYAERCILCNHRDTENTEI